LAGIGAGAVALFTQRVFRALLSFEKQIVKWPDTDERRSISRRFDVNYGLKGCVDIVDGTRTVFSQRLHIDGDVY
jgi:hypothetical protein